MAVDDLLDTAAAAAHVGCSTFTIRYRMRNVGLTPAVTLGRSPFFTKADLDAHFREKPFLEDRRRKDA